LGALTPLALNVPGYWQGLLAGANGCDFITKFDTTNFKTKFACELKGFDPNNHFDRKEARKMDPFTHYVLAAADEAIQDAGLNFDTLDKDRAGVVIGSGIGGLTTLIEEARQFVQGEVVNAPGPDGAPPKFAVTGQPRFNPFFIPKMIVDIAAGHLSIKYGLRGPNYAVISACATSTNCLIDGWMLIRLGLADLVVCGGSESAISEMGIGGFNAMRAMSERNDDPKTASRPFDKDRDGFVLGEGSGVVVLESAAHALKRGARIYAEFAGVGLSADANHITAPHPDGLGVAMMMRNSLAQSGIQPHEVDYINVHGTSTPLGDIAETKSIKQVFGDHAYKLNISSTKSMIGHLLGGAGVVEAIATILSVYHDEVHPTINHFNDDPECDLNYTFHKSVKRTINVAMSNNYGFGGHNASVIFRKFQA
jgi:3-oxoacyl-[acyl-carrier-protein] synthase II